VSDAVALAQAGDIIALAVGEYVEMVELNAAIAVVGACAAQTVLSPAAIETDEATVEIFAPGARLANLRVTGPEAGVFVAMSFGEVVLASVEVLNVSHVGIAQSDGGTVRLEDVVVRDTRPRLVLDDLGVGLATLVGSMQADRVVLEHNRTAGVVVSGPSASLDARDLVVRDTLPQSVDGAWGDGIYTEDGAVASFERVLCDGNADAAVSAIGSSVQLTDGVLRATEVQLKDQLWGVGIYAEGGAISGQRILMSDNAMGGVWAVGPGSEVTLVDARVESSLGIPPYDQGGHGYHFEAGATGTLDRITSDANRGVGVLIRGSGTTVGGADVVVTNTLANSGEGGLGMGYAVVEGGEGELQRAWLEGNVGAGLGCEGPGGIDVEDLHVMETKSREGGLFGEGIDAEFGCQLGVQRAVLRRNHEVGIALVHSGTKAELREVLITDTLPQPHTNLWGLGVEVIAGADVALAGAVSIGNRYAGVSVWGEGAKLTVTDLVVRETYSGDEDLFYGFGLEASSGASLTAARVDIEASRAVGVLADSPNTVANITDLSVFDTLRGDCATATAVGDWCEDPANDPNNAGSLVAWEQAELSVDRFELARSRCGVILARDASLTLSNGVVHGNAIGLNLRVPSYDTSLVMGPTVRYFDNGTNVDAVELLLPDVPTREMP